MKLTPQQVEMLKRLAYSPMNEADMSPPDKRMVTRLWNLPGMLAGCYQRDGVWRAEITPAGIAALEKEPKP